MSRSRKSKTFWRIAFALVKCIIFFYLAMFALYIPLAGSTNEISFNSLDDGGNLYSHLSGSLVRNSFMPSLLSDAAFIGLFPSWRVQRFALPIIAVLTLAGWAWWMWWWYGPNGRNASFSITADRWPLVAAGPAGIIAAAAFVFLLARARQFAAPVS